MPIKITSVAFCYISTTYTWLVNKGTFNAMISPALSDRIKVSTLFEPNVDRPLLGLLEGNVKLV